LTLGYKVTVGPNGTLKAEGADGTEDAVALSTYYTKCIRSPRKDWVKLDLSNNTVYE